MGEAALKTECTGEQLEFHVLGRRLVSGRFAGGRISSDAGGVLLREVEKRTGVTARMSRCFVDYRNRASVEHDVHELVSQRVYGIALGHEDLNGHGELRGDAVPSLLVGKSDVTGEKRIRERGYALASASTLNRMELGEPDAAANHRYKRIVARPEAFGELLVELLVESHSRAPREIRLDLDATDGPLHGHQEGRFFHGYYGCYCYRPRYIFCGEHLLCARLRESNRDASAGSIEELEHIVGQIRRHWPRTGINIRGDSGFCRDSLMKWCEDHGVGFVPGLARNQRLIQALGGAIHEAHSVHRRTGLPVRRFRDFTYRTRKSWSRKRPVVGKAEYLSKGENPRFVVTNLSLRKAAARRLYEKLYCAHGDMENRIKEQQLDLFADRTNAHTMRANRLRLYFSSFAYVLMHALRRLGTEGTQFARAQCATLRLKLLKIGARVKITARRVWLSFSQAYPYAKTFTQVLANLPRAPLGNPSG